MFLRFGSRIRRGWGREPGGPSYPRRQVRLRLRRRLPGTPDALLFAVCAQLQTIYRTRPPQIPFSAEELAVSLGLAPHVVRQALHRLDLLGVVSQAERCFAHDTSRNRMFPGRDSGWGANVYYLRRPPASA